MDDPLERKQRHARTTPMKQVQTNATENDGLLDMERCKSEPADYQDKSYRDEVASQVDPEVLAKMHVFAQTMKKKRQQGGLFNACRCQPSPVVRNLKDFQSAWGKGGSWLVLPELPPDRKEQPHNVRLVQRMPEESGNKLDQWGIGYLNAKGCKKRGDDIVGQDSFSVARLSNGWEVICVMDGHGPNGEFPSNRGCETLPFILSSESCTTMLKHGKVESALLYAFFETEKDLEERAAAVDVDICCCGCTATVVLRNPVEAPNKVWVATVGDSRAMLFSKDAGVIRETEDHKPTLPQEAARLEKLGCEIRSRTHANGFVETRVYVKGCDYPGLCMTRCLGDCIVKELGVTWEPVIEEWNCPADTTLVLASDGVWEFMSGKQVADTILEKIADRCNPLAACAEVASQARHLWRQNEGAYYCDDITIVLFPMSLPCAPRSTQVAVQDKGEPECGGCTIV